MALNHWLVLWGSPPISCLWWHPDAAPHRKSTSASITLKTPQAQVIGLWFITVYHTVCFSAAPLFITDKLYMNCGKINAAQNVFPSKFALPDCHWRKPRCPPPPALWNSFLKGDTASLLSLWSGELLIGFVWQDYCLLSGPVWTLCPSKNRICVVT